MTFLYIMLQFGNAIVICKKNYMGFELNELDAVLEALNYDAA